MHRPYPKIPTHLNIDANAAGVIPPLLLAGNAGAPCVAAGAAAAANCCNATVNRVYIHLMAALSLLSIQKYRAAPMHTLKVAIDGSVYGRLAMFIMCFVWLLTPGGGTRKGVAMGIVACAAPDGMTEDLSSFLTCACNTHQKNMSRELSSANLRWKILLPGRASCCVHGEWMCCFDVRLLLVPIAITPLCILPW